MKPVYFLASTPREKEKFSLPNNLIKLHELPTPADYQICVYTNPPVGERISLWSGKRRVGDAPTQHYVGATEVRRLVQQDDDDNLLCWIEHRPEPTLCISSAHPHECDALFPLYAEALRVNRSQDNKVIAKQLRKKTVVEFRAECVPGILLMADRHSGRTGVQNSSPGTLADPLNPYEADARRATGLAEAELRELEAKQPQAAAWVLARGSAQAKFRRDLIIAYGCACAVCGLSLPSALEAAHIQPWATLETPQQYDATNGLLLCANHHRLFDAHLIRLGEDLTIQISADVSALSQPECKRALSYHGKRIRAPYPASWAPNKKYISARYSEAPGA